MIGVNAMGQKSLRAIADECFDTATVEAVLQLVGTDIWARDKFKMSIKTPANCLEKI